MQYKVPHFLNTVLLPEQHRTHTLTSNVQHGSFKERFVGNPLGSNSIFGSTLISFEPGCTLDLIV